MRVAPHPIWYQSFNEHPIVSATFHGHEHILGWVHMNSSRVKGLTGSFEEFFTAPSGGGSYNAYIYPARMDYFYPNMGSDDDRGFGFITVDGNSFTFSIYHVGTTVPVWSRTFTNNYRPTPTSTFTFTPSDTPTDTYTPSPTDTVTPTETITETFTPSLAETVTPTGTITATDTSTLTPTETSTLAVTSTTTYTMSSTSTRTVTPTAAPAQTPTRAPSSYNFLLPLVIAGKNQPVESVYPQLFQYGGCATMPVSVFTICPGISGRDTENCCRVPRNAVVADSRETCWEPS